MQLTDVRIEGDFSYSSPTIDTTYLEFKIVWLENFHFVSTSKEHSILGKVDSPLIGETEEDHAYVSFRQHEMPEKSASSLQ